MRCACFAADRRTGVQVHSQIVFKESKMEENMKQMISQTPANWVRSALEARFLRSIYDFQEGAVDPASLDFDQIGQNWEDSNRPKKYRSIG